ncbi:flexible cuticle protein 12-like [Episyrphus balteatus]|uniref:flexible cuticle protein 12-like n=1 Tax=Episyrphus balteatus TaxID=286459 RepID=UPI0024868495|nr:flexible cuticle protein 12-like [Episyrphus balteatus]
MLKFVKILFVIGFVAAIPLRIENDEESTVIPEVISIIKSESNQDADGSYNFVYESSDGSGREENAEIVNPGTEDEKIKITGSYKYIDADGQEVLVTYTADENGFVPISSIIPKEISDNALAAKDLPKLEHVQELAQDLVPPVEEEADYSNTEAYTE